MKIENRIVANAIVDNAITTKYTEVSSTKGINPDRKIVTVRKGDIFVKRSDDTRYKKDKLNIPLMKVAKILDCGVNGVKIVPEGHSNDQYDIDSLYFITAKEIKNSIVANAIVGKPQEGDTKMKITNPIVANAIAKPVCNGIGDCFADAVFGIESVAKEKDAAKIKNGLKQAKIDVQYAKTYDGFDAADKLMLSECVKAIDRAIADPSSKNIIAARWECEKARAAEDGGSPRRAFWNSSVAVKNEKAYGVPRDLWQKIYGTRSAYIIAGELKKGKSVDEILKRLYDSAIGNPQPVRSADFMKGVHALAEMKKRGLNAESVAANAESPFYKQFAGYAKTAIDEIHYNGECELRVLIGKTQPIVDAAKNHGDMNAVVEITRKLNLLNTALEKYHSDGLRTIG